MSVSTLNKVAKGFNLAPDALWQEAWSLFCKGIRVDIQAEIKAQLEPYGALTSASLRETIKAIEVAILIENLERVTEMIDQNTLRLEHWCKLSGASRGEMIKDCLLLFMNTRRKAVLAKHTTESIEAFEQNAEDIQRLIDVLRGTDPEDCEWEFCAAN